MDARRFDALTRALSIGSRRGLLGLLLAVPGLSFLLAFFTADDAEAKGRRKRRKKRHKHGKGNGRHRKGKRNRTCKRKSRAKICAGKCGSVKNRKTCKKKVDCGPCVACSETEPCSTGCCTGDGSCQPGTTPQACGIDGATCQVCTDTELCDGGCQPCDVCTNGCPNDSINAAIADANDGDVIRICGGAYQETETIVIDKSLTLSGAGQEEAGGTVLDGQDARRVVEVADGVTDVFLEGLRITGGNSSFGAGVFNSGEVTLTDCTLADNSTVGGASNRPGGAIDNAGMLTLTGCTVTGNAADVGGGIFTFGEMWITGSMVSGNTAVLVGGGVANAGTAFLSSTTVTGNKANGGGGGIDNNGTSGGANLTLIDCAVTNNKATNGEGGGILNRNGATVSLEGDSHVCDNAPDQCEGFTPPAGVCLDECPA